MIEGLFAERQQVESHFCREVTRSLREVRTPEIGGRSDRGHQVCDERHVEHLLDGDPAHRRAPPVDGAGLTGSQAIASAVLEAELRSHRGGHWFDPSIAHQVSAYVDLS